MFKTLIHYITTKYIIQSRHLNLVCKVPAVPPTKTTVSPNGIRVITEETNNNFTCVSLFVEAGPRFETAKNNGVTHLIEHMAFKGFKSLNRDIVENEIEGLGAKVNITTTRELQVFSSTCCPDSVPNIVDYYSRIINELELSDFELELEKQNICWELIDIDNDPKEVMFDYLHQTAFQGTPLSQRVIGPSENIQKIGRSVIAKYINEHYQPRNFVLAASGYVSHEDMLHHTKKYFGNLKANPCAAPDYGPCRFTGSQIMYRDDSMPFAHVALAFEVPGYNSQEYLTCMLAAALVGSWNRSQGGDIRNSYPLARRASDGNLCESFDSFYIPYRDVGLWGIYFVTDKLSIEDMLYNVQTQWMNLTTTTTDVELFRVVNDLKRRLAKSFDGSVNSCYDAGKQMMYLRQRITLPQMLEHVSSLRHHNIREFGQKYLYEKCPAVASVGPTENLPEYTRIRAGQYWLRL